MAEKPTKRERKDEAKRRRLEEMRRRQRRARMRKLYLLGTVAAVIVAILLAVIVSRSSNSRAKNAAAKLAASAGCEPPKEYPSEGREHISPPATVKYKTDPPTSGNHYAQASNPPAPGPTGILASALPDEAQVHNLEHGHIIIQYQPGSLDAATMTKLEEFVRSDSQWLMLAPRDNRDAKVALTAWQVLQKCDSPNDKIVEVAKAFRDRFKNKGPESIPGQAVFQTPAPAPSSTATGSPKPSTATTPKPSTATTPKPSGSPTT